MTELRPEELPSHTLPEPGELLSYERYERIDVSLGCRVCEQLVSVLCSNPAGTFFSRQSRLPDDSPSRVLKP